LQHLLVGKATMAMKSLLKPSTFRPIPSFSVFFARQSTHIRSLHQHRSLSPPPIPSPTPFVPDVQTFLTLIGRGLSKHAAKITTWRQLFTLSSEQFKELGVEPPRSRRYLLQWCQRFRNGRFGIGGDFTHIKDGIAELRVVEVPTRGKRPATATQTPNTRKIVVNVDPEGNVLKSAPEALVPAKSVYVRGAHTITGPHVLPVAGGRGAKIVIKEGLWEDRRGHKIDGGERRQAEVRAKRRAEAKKAAAR